LCVCWKLIYRPQIHYYSKSFLQWNYSPLRPCPMALLKGTFNMFNHWSGVVENDKNLSWRKEMMKLFTKLNADWNRPRGAKPFAETGAWDARADRAREWQGKRREKEKLINVVTLGMFWLAAWIFIFLIIWTQLFHCK